MMPNITLGKGTYVVTLTVDDGRGGTDSDTTIVTVRDTTPPSINIWSATPEMLWPPNHKMVPITVGALASDNCDPAPVTQIISVTSNEPINGQGDGDTEPDWEITGPLTLNLRAERSGKGAGRNYTITIQTTDSSDNSSTETISVSVPKSKSKK
jgi:hypothetical protein